MRFKVIYADPPWSYDDRGCQGAAEAQYALMSNADISRLPVHVLADDDCALFMWGTYPLLDVALATIKCWGFEFVGMGFDWVKLNPKALTPCFKLGRMTRGNTEPCLYARRGRPKRVDAGVAQLIEVDEIVRSPIRRHSAKPPEVRDRIVQLMGDVPRIELFARERAQGWCQTGLELDGIDVRDALKMMAAINGRAA